MEIGKHWNYQVGIWEGYKNCLTLPGGNSQ